MVEEPKSDCQHRQSRDEIIDALEITAHRAVDMPEEMRRRILATQPTAEEIATGKWYDAS